MTNSVVKVDVIRTGDGVNSIPVGEMISKVAKIPVNDDLATAQDLSDLSLSIADVNDVAQEALTEAQQNATHVMSIKWEPSRDIIGAGDAALDGQLLSRATYPDAWAAIEAGIVPTIDDATWLSDPTQRGKFTSGDGSTTFRLPDYNGKAAGSLGAVFLRGDGALSAAVAGVIQQDAMQGHKHGATYAVSGATYSTGNPYTQGAGGVGGDTVNGGLHVSGMSGATGPQVLTGAPYSDGINGTPRTATETRPLNVTGCWVIKLFGAVVNIGSADAAQLASDFANLSSRTTTLENIGKPFTKEYVSSQQTITPGGGLSVGHGLGVIPKVVTAELVCTVADLGYAVGAIVEYPLSNGGPSNYGTTVEKTSSLLSLRFGSTSLTLLHKTTGGWASVTPSSWRLILRAFA